MTSQRASEVSVPVPSDDSGKWLCSNCTYNNWPSSLKCTMCRTPKPLLTIEEASTGSRSPSYESIEPVVSEKWTCTVCTYRNWPKGTKCVQCAQPKPKKDHNKPVPPQLSPPGVQLSPSVGGEGVVGGGLSPRPSTSMAESTPIDSKQVAKKLLKWTCAACTYENWPKTYKCIMCYSTKPGLLITSRNSVQNVSRNTSAQNSPPQSPVGPRDKKRVLVGGGSENEGSGRKSPKSSASSASSTENLAAAAPQYIEQEDTLERQWRRIRKSFRQMDYLWLNAVRSVCTSVYDTDPVEAYLAAGGEPARSLTQSEVQILGSNSFGMEPVYNLEVGYTLIHVAVRYQREDVLALLIANADTHNQGKCLDPQSSSGVSRRLIKRVPCHTCPDTAADIRRQLATCLRQRKGEFSCFYMTDLTTFALPYGIFDLQPSMQKRLFDELLDRGVQKELEEESAIINWNLDVTDRLGSRLFALWNRTAGDCLLDSVLQATWGVFDTENSLRQALADSLADAALVFYPRWREFEARIARSMEYSLDETQFARDWDMVLQMASKPGAALEQAHIFALAHIIRRPIIVYGVRIVKSYRGEYALDYARFEGIYLPLLWEQSFCWRSPICLGYTRGHFSALVPMEPKPYDSIGGSCVVGGGDSNNTVSSFPGRHVFLPLQDADGKPLPVHFLQNNELGMEQVLLRTWLDISVTDAGLWCCKMKLHRPAALVQQMIDDWLDSYRRLGQIQQPAVRQINRSKGNTASNSPNRATSTPPSPAAEIVKSISGGSVSLSDRLPSVPESAIADVSSQVISINETSNLSLANEDEDSSDSQSEGEEEENQSEDDQPNDENLHNENNNENIIEKQ